MIDRERLVREFIELARIPSLSKKERAVAEVVADKLRALGLEPRFDSAGESIGGDVGNLRAHLPATDPNLPCLLFNAHMDTVAPGEGIEPAVDGDRIFSLSDTIVGADDKGGVVVILEALRHITALKLPHGGIDVVFTVAEEVGLLGAKHLDYSNVQAAMGYVMDGGQEEGAITVAAPYANSIDFVVRGRAAHAGVCPEKGINAIQAASRGIAAMKLGRIDEETTANVGVITGGEASNIVPERCSVEGEARSHSESKLRAQTDHMVKSMKQAAEGMGAQVEIDVQRSYNGFRLTEKDPVVALAIKAARQMGVEPKLQVGGGGSDANIFNERGIPSVILATGHAEVHTTNEYAVIPAMVRAAEWLVAIVGALSTG